MGARLVVGLDVKGVELWVELTEKGLAVKKVFDKVTLLAVLLAEVLVET